jgi:hypothetical protein
MICIKDCKLSGKDNIIRLGDNIIVDMIDDYGIYIRILKLNQQFGLSWYCYIIPTCLVQEHFLNLAEWREQQINSILDGDD